MDKIIERDKNILIFLKSKYLIYIALIIIILLGVYIRSLPLTDHNGRPGLWDITTNDYTLGPDLDPFLFLRYAKMLDINGSIPTIDTMRYVPKGYDTSGEALLVSWMIYLTHNIINIISSTEYSISYAAALLPVLMFGFTILFFFLFVNEIFYKKKEKNHLYAGMIAIISTMFLIVVPSLLARTIAGIPEKESVGFALMFLAAWLFLKSWKEDDHPIKSSIYSLLAGISSGLMGLAWGGVVYLFVSIPLASMMAFILNKFKKINYVGFALWQTSAMVVMLSFSNKFNIRQFFMSIGFSLGTILLFVFMLHILLQKLKIYTWLKSKYSYSKIWNIPENILSIVVALIVVLVGACVMFGPSFLITTFSGINQALFNPSAGGRWATTVAENRQPYFSEWLGNFGQFIFFLFIFGSIFFISNAFSMLNKKENTAITGSYAFLLLGIIYSRYSPTSIFNGENIISKIFYLASILIFISTLIYLYSKYHKNNINIFEKIDFGYLFLIIFFIITLLTARSAIRLIMVLAMVAPIFISFVIIELIKRIKETSKQNDKTVMGIILIIALLISCFSGYQYYNITKNQAYNYVPYYYTFQWQQAMSWVRDNTPTNAVFAHWWDYGYWVQSLGERATITDGGNNIGYWNYLMGRLVLTGDNQKDSLDFLYMHKATHLLIDSSDIGKYGAFSQIGSNEYLDRFSSGPILMRADPKSVQETRNGTIEAYQTTAYLDEDIYYGDSVIFKENGAVLGVIMETNNGPYTQPLAVFYNRGQQVKIPMRYLYYGGVLVDFNTGINATAYPIQSISQIDQGLNINPTGSLIYLSPKIMRGFLGQVYILNDPLDNFPAFKLDYAQEDFILQQISMQGASLNEFVDYNGIRGPIKIWGIKYSYNQKDNPKYLNTTLPSDITWQF